MISRKVPEPFQRITKIIDSHDRKIRHLETIETPGSTPTFSSIDFPEIAEPASPAADTMRLFAVDDSGITVLETKDADGQVFRIMQDTYRVARNTTGSQIDKGDVVYFSGSTGNKPNIALARANAEATMPAIGVAAEDIADTTFGIVTVIGRIEDVDTSAFSEGDTLYVSATTAGALTATRPEHPNFAQSIGTVEVSGVGSGAILLNTEPTLLGRDSGTILNNFTIGDQAAGAKTLTFDNGNLGVVSWEPTADRTVTMPDATGTVALKNINNSFSASQSIVSDIFPLLALDRTANANVANVYRISPSFDGSVDHLRFQLGDGTDLAVLTEQARWGVGTTAPLAKFHFEETDINLAAAHITSSGTPVVGVLSGIDAAFELFSREDGVWGSKIGLAEIDSADNGLEDKWGIVRQTTAGTGNSSLHLTFGTNRNVEANTSLAQLTTAGHFLINTTTDAAQLTVDQSSTTAAIPVVSLDQADLSEGFIDFIASAGAGNPIDTAALGTYYGKIAVEINGVRKVIPVYDS